MKLKHTLSLLSVAVVGLAFAAPAIAQEPRTSISAPQGLAPTGVVEVGYPYMAAALDLSGECRVSVNVANGATHDVHVLDCTSGYFRNAARRAATQLSFASSAQARDAVIVVRWTNETPAKPTQTASR